MIEAQRLRITYYLPSDHPDAGGVRARLDRLAADRLGRVLDEAMAKAIPTDDKTIWMIDSLDVSLDLDVDTDSEAVTHQWARAIARAVVHRYEHPPDDCGDYRFTDEADLLGRYFVDVASGHENKWYYSRFDGLTVLPASAKIRTLLFEDPLTGLAALRRLSMNARNRVIAVLSENDARRAFAAIAGAVAENVPLERLWTSWEDEGRPVPSADDEARWALRIGISSGSCSNWAHNAPAVAGLLRLAPEIGEALLDALSRNQVVALFRLLPISEAETLSPLLGISRTELERWVAPVGAKHEAEQQPLRSYTRFGGAFLVLPFLSGIPVPEGIVPSVLFRFYLLLKCLGPRAYTAFLDPVLREIPQVDANLSIRDFGKWQNGLPIDALQVCLKEASAADVVRPNAASLKPVDHRYLRLPAQFRAEHRRDHLVSHIANIVIRALAWRLPGFANASFQHLSGNFFEAEASIQTWPDRRVVRLSAPPLGVLLNMTGLSRQRFVCSWLDELPFELYPERP